MQGYDEENNPRASPGQCQWALGCFLKFVKELQTGSVDARESGVQGRPPRHSDFEINPAEAVTGQLVGSVSSVESRGHSDRSCGTNEASRQIKPYVLQLSERSRHALCALKTFEDKLPPLILTSLHLPSV